MKKRFVFLVLLVMLCFLFAPALNLFSSEKAILRIGVMEEPDSLNPFAAYERAAFETFMLIYDSLVVFDRNLNPSPSLAESWKLSADNLSWTFRLRKDVLWSDGKPFTARDVKFTYEAIRDTEMGLYATLVEDITEVEILDDYTVVIHSENPKANMLMNITPILPAHIWEKLSEEKLETFENKDPVGTGPFRLLQWKKSQYLTLGANMNHFRGAPKTDGIIFSLYANRDTLAQSLRLGEIDAALGVYHTHAKGVAGDPNIQVIEFTENGFTELAFNCWDDPASGGNPLILDTVIRQAIELGIDKQRIIDIVYEGEGVPGSTLIPVSQTFYHYTPSAEEYRGFNPEKGRALLDAAGYLDRDGDGIRESAEGSKLSFVFLLRAENTMEVKAGQLISGFLRDLGIETKIETLDDGALNDRIFGPADFDMFIWGWGGDVDPGTLLNVLTTGQIENLNDVYYSNPEYDSLVALQWTLMDKYERRDAVWAAQRILYNDLPYIILLYETELQMLRKDKIAGISTTVNGAVFYADTPANYIEASVIGLPATVGLTKQDIGGSPLPFILGAVVLVAAAVVVIILLRRRKKKSW